VRARLQVEGMREAVSRIDHVGDRARRAEPALGARQTLRDLQASEERRFATGRGWKRLTPRWAAEKRRRGLDPRILRATGRLYGALTHGGAGVTFHAYRNELRWGITPGRGDLHYAQPLAKGAGRLPKRRMVVIDREARDRISVRVERYIAYGEVT
jgi:hypothetical protein